MEWSEKMITNKLRAVHKKIGFLFVAGTLGLVLPLMAVSAGEEQHEKKKQEIQGIVETMPTHLQGVWKIGGRQVMAKPSTQFKQKKCALKVGALAEAEYTTEGQTLVAEEIKCETEVEIKGLVQALPANRLGVWKIADQTATATAQTHFDETSCPIKLGSLIEAKVYLTPQGLALKEVECETDED